MYYVRTLRTMYVYATGCRERRHTAHHSPDILRSRQAWPDRHNNNNNDSDKNNVMKDEG